jgi:glucose-1-phosphate cytidylyltransferase
MEETTLRPKPMVEVGGRPVIRHIMQLYASHGFDDFVVAAGYKAEMIEAYFRREQGIAVGIGETWLTNRLQVEVVDTGASTMTGGRIRRLEPRLADETFMATYGDGLADVDLQALLHFHRSHGRIATLTAVHPPEVPGRFPLDDPHEGGTADSQCSTWVNGGFFVFEPRIFDYLEGDGDVLEAEPLSRLARDGELMAFQHGGFWQCMDTAAERDLLEQLWRSGCAPWERTAATPVATIAGAARSNVRHLTVQQKQGSR